MIKETYCSFEVAKLLKEKGFNEQCRAAYTNYGKIFTTQIQQYITNVLCSKSNLWECTAPTHQMAMAWLREVHNLFIFPFPQRNTDSFWAEIYSIDKNKNEEDKWENLYCETIDLKNYPTYEEAVETGLKYCLQNLI